MDKLNRLIVPSRFLKLLNMYEDRDLESFASDRACLELSKQGFKTTLLFIEAKNRASKSGLIISERARGQDF